MAIVPHDPPNASAPQMKAEPLHSDDGLKRLGSGHAVLRDAALRRRVKVLLRSEDNVVRPAALIIPIVLVACADQSKGSALNECRMRYYLVDASVQEQLITDCMKARSFAVVPACDPAADEYEWDWQVQSFPYDDPRCYRSIGAAPWVATVLSPM
jgi:hypothetical protein